MIAPDLGARALDLERAGKDAPEIARILTAELPHGSRPITADEARELYQAEFWRQRAARFGAENETAARRRSALPDGGESGRLVESDPQPEGVARQRFRQAGQGDGQ